eukprot:GEZU01027343.1.p1 GENE.GEZU01027343.1~~GEZU01027343.1.p1  ORF type:complete len:102 (-),score=9.58 GEZU01027343.1:227-532(-)
MWSKCILRHSTTCMLKVDLVNHFHIAISTLVFLLMFLDLFWIDPKVIMIAILLLVIDVDISSFVIDLGRSMAKKHTLTELRYDSIGFIFVKEYSHLCNLHR